MKVNHDNYESFFIDYLDGNLANEFIDDLLDFLRENPDMARELRGLDNIKLEPTESDSFINIESLLKNDLDQPDVFDENCIRYIENEMDENEKENFIQFIGDKSQHRRIFEIFQATRLIPDTSVVFRNINSLKRRTKLITPAWYWAAAAVLLIGFFLISIPETTETVIQTVSIQSKGSNSGNQTKAKPEVLQEKIYAETEDKQKDVDDTPVPKNKTEEILQPEILDVNREVITYLKVKPVQLLAVEPCEMVLIEIKAPDLNQKDYSKYQSIPEFLASEVKKIEPRQKLNQVGIGTLKTLRTLSNEKFDFASNQQGKVQKLEFNSKLLAFTIPVNTEK